MGQQTTVGGKQLNHQINHHGAADIAARSGKRAENIESGL